MTALVTSSPRAGKEAGGRGACPGARAYTLIELLATLAALIILLGLMVSLARYARTSSADQVTKDILRWLDGAMAQYIAQNDSVPPDTAPLIPGATSDTRPAAALSEAGLTTRAEANNRQFVRLLKSNHMFPYDHFENLSISYYDDLTVRDAWGSPIVFMPRMDPAVGMAAKGWFFFSAGPDRKYTTKQDNLYSYELPGVDR